MEQKTVTRKLRSLFLSDMHLGTRACQAELLLNFLRHHDAETIYLVGDIIDFWRMKRGWYWPQLHDEVIQKILGKGRDGSRLVYIPGNHDAFLRTYEGSRFNGMEVCRQAFHVTASGQRYLIAHGDEFDAVRRYIKWVAAPGEWVYLGALLCNSYFSGLRRKCGLPLLSIPDQARLKIKHAVNLMAKFERAVLDEVERVKANGVVCGHMHVPSMRQVNGVQYINCGDWVESCTAVGETAEGDFEMIHWPVLRQAQARRKLVAHTVPA